MAQEYRHFSEHGTITVAASDSLDKSGTRFICDGVDDQVEIQTAIDALPSTGGEIILLEGTYSLSDVIIGKDYCNIKGQGFGTILDVSIATFKASIVMGDFSSLSFLKINGSIVPLQNIYINRLASGNHCAIDNIWMNAVATGIYITDKQDVSVSNCFLTNIKGTNEWAAGFYVFNSNHISGKSVFISDCDRGVEIEEGAYSVFLQGFFIENCSDWAMSVRYIIQLQLKML